MAYRDGYKNDGYVQNVFVEASMILAQEIYDLGHDTWIPIARCATFY
jgi:hypothetical protein